MGAVEKTEGESCTPFDIGEFDAVGIIEGFIETPGDTPEEQGVAVVKAWQTIIDSGLVWKLQGRFGRQAAALIEEGICSPPPAQAD